LKFISIFDRSAALRFTLEAQSQARVEHPAVCRVYEVGEWQGEPYIALQYIDGRPLTHCADELILEEKVDLIRQVAEGLHAAHRLGLIHRDVKTGNIMVEKRGDGSWQPFVMDFGLARVTATPSVTQTGLILGTPAFMPPEQARGDSSKMDRRSDVYALGVTLYELLTGRLPFDAKSSVDVLVAVITEDPVPPRQIAPQLPPDLESITLKCMEKEPSRRYESALALAEDLQRFLDGDPVNARQIGPLQRLQRRIRKHPVASSLVTGSILAAMGLGGWGILSAWNARDRAAIAQRLGQEVEQIDAMLRYAHLLPPHDLRGEKARVRQRMESIRQNMAHRGAAARAPGHGALGRGHLSLGEVELARGELELAWKLGQRQPEIARALGRSLARLYQQALAEARRIADPLERSRRKEHLATTLKAPALAYLRQSHDPSGEGSYTEGIIALQDERFEEALGHARRAWETLPWLYEGMALEGQIWAVKAASLRERGEYAPASAAVTASLEAYDRALRIARSDDQLLIGKARACEIEVNLRAEKGLPTDEPFELGMESLREARRIDPDRPDSFLLESKLQWQRSSDLANSGRDGRPALRLAIAAGKEAIRLGPGIVAHYEALAMANWYLAQMESSHGGDGEPFLKQAEAALGQADGLDPRSAVVQRNLGVVHGIRAEDCFRTGADPRPEVERSVAAFRKAIAFDPGFNQAYTNLGNALRMLAMAQAERGTDPTQAVEQTEAALQKALELNPRQPEAWDERGSILQMRAAFRFAVGEDPLPDIEQALGHFAKALEGNPAMPQAHIHRAEILLLKAQCLRSSGKDPGAALQGAMEACAKARAIDRDYAEIAATFVDILLLEAELRLERKLAPDAGLREARGALKSALRRDASSPFLWERVVSMELMIAQAGRDPERALKAADAALQKAEGQSAPTPPNLLLRGRLARQRGLLALRAGRSPEPALQSGLQALGRSLKLNPRQPEVRALRGALLLLQALGQQDSIGRKRDAGAAREELDQALRANGFLRREWQEKLDEASRLAAS
jgi:serine/threonine-protein kinase